MPAHRFPRLILKLRTLFRGEQIDHELDEEIRYHVERKTEQLIAQGLPSRDARYAALRAFGGVEQRKEACRDARGPWASIWVERLAQDVRHGVRMLVRSPGFTLIAMLSIAIGVGANAAMFSIADGLILRPLNVADADGLVTVSSTTPLGDVRYNAVSYPDYVDLRDRVRSFEGLAAEHSVLASLTRAPAETARGSVGAAVSANFFDVLGVRPSLGRTLLPDDDRIGNGAAVVVLAHETWTERFGADPAVIGTAIRLTGIPFTIVGVAPAGFTGTNLYVPPAYYVPLAMLPAIDAQRPRDVLERRDLRSLRVIGRLKPGVSVDQASAEAGLLAVALQREHPQTNERRGLLVDREMDARFDQFGPAAALGGMLMGLALAVLLVACANVAGLLTSRSPARAREIAVRLASGGSRARLVRQLMTESALIAVAGGAAGLALGYAGVRSFQQFQFASDIGIRFTFELDRRALAVGLGIAALSALLSSVIPAWRSTRLRDLSTALRNTATPTGRTARVWGRHGLVALQIAMTLVLLTVALSFYRAFEAEYGRGPGFRTDHLLLTSLDPGFARYDARQSDLFYRRLIEQVGAIPGVTSVGLTSFVPLSQDGASLAVVVPAGVVLPPGTDGLTVMTAAVDETYLDAVGIPVLDGRGIQSTDTADTPRVAVISQGAAARYWPGESALGKRIQLVGPDGGSAQVVGVTADVKFRLFTPAATPFLYLPRLQKPSMRSTLVVRTEGDPLAVAEPVRTAVHQIDREVPILGMRTMAAFYDANARNLNTVVVRTIAGMGTMGLALALVGLYGLTAYAVSRRTREIGIRMAIGGLPNSMLGMILRQGSLPAFSGVALGVLASWAAGSLIRAAFPGTGVDAVTFALIVPVVVAVVMLAAYVPARRAARIDPLVALRQD